MYIFIKNKREGAKVQTVEERMKKYKNDGTK
jgi:hypothetical protein